MCHTHGLPCITHMACHVSHMHALPCIVTHACFSMHCDTWLAMCHSHGSPCVIHMARHAFGLYFFQIVFLEELSHVLCLISEGALLKLFVLKTKEEVELSHHAHLKFAMHRLDKLFTK